MSIRRYAHLNISCSLKNLKKKKFQQTGNEIKEELCLSPLNIVLLLIREIQR